MRKHENANRLPYLNSLPMIGLVLGINLIFGLLQPLWGLTHASILTDAAICGVTTSFICVWATRRRLRKLAREGALPATPPQPALIRRLPKNPWLLSLVFAVVFAVCMPLINELLLRFYAITAYTPMRFLAWKLVYSALLSAKISELAILRLVQPDCLQPGDPPQTGQSAVKNPLPKGDAFAKLFNTVTTDFGFNMLIGLLFGGTLVVENNVVILPATRAGILISGAILGAIITIRMIYPVVSSIRKLKESGGLPPMGARIPLVAWLPEKPVLFTLILAPLAIVISPLVIGGVLAFFGFEVLNFFQYFCIRSIYVSLLTKPVVRLAILRYMQPSTTEGSAVHV